MFPDPSGAFKPHYRERETQAVYFQHTRRPDQRGEAPPPEPQAKAPQRVFSLPAIPTLRWLPLSPQR